jgi:hypothetical protein
VSICGPASVVPTLSGKPSFPVDSQMAQDHWANLDYRKNRSLAGVVRNKGDNEIMAMGTYTEVDADHAEVAFMVREDSKGLGIASYIL